jgi:putative intracellular protease/amidase
MKSTAYLLIFDGLADWEPAHALCEINKSGKFDVITAGFSRTPISTMAGLKLTPDLTIDNLDEAAASILVFPGGDMWEKKSDEKFKALLRRLHGRSSDCGDLRRDFGNCPRRLDPWRSSYQQRQGIPAGDGARLQGR